MIVKCLKLYYAVARANKRLIKVNDRGRFLGHRYWIGINLLTGPVFFALIKTSIEKGFRAGSALALGVVTSDVVFVGAIIFGSQFLMYRPM